MVKENEDGTLSYRGKIYAEVVTSTQASIPETKEAVFAELVKDLVQKEDRKKYPDSVFWFNKDGQCMFEHDEKNAYFLCSYYLVWSVFETKFGMNYQDIQEFTKGMLEQHFKCKNVTTCYSVFAYKW